jgi:hypothetical protein
LGFKVIIPVVYYEKQLKTTLSKINTFIMENIATLPNIPFSERVLNKCKETKCYMFLVRGVILFDFIIHHEI